MINDYFSTRLKQVTLTNFRTYPFLELQFENPFIVFTGPNGVGKTNILEAISFFGPGRGLRRARLSEVATRGDFSEKQAEKAYVSLGWGVSGHIQTYKGLSHIGTGILQSNASQYSSPEVIRQEEAEKRHIRIDEKEVSSQTDLERLLTVLWIVPSQDRLLGEGTTVRRKFFDRLVSSLYPEHGTRLYRYDYALRERSRLLREGKRDPYWLNTLEQTLAEEGIALTAQRQEVLNMLDEVFKTIPLLVHFPIPTLRLEGALEKLLEENAALVAEDLFRKKLEESRSLDAEQGGAIVGPHLTDLSIIFKEKDLPIHYCSMGEQKALLLSLLLAHCHIHSLCRQESPLFLLDEGVGHLDEFRRKMLFSILEHMQVQTFLTATEKDVFNDLQDKADFFKVETGKVVKEI